jgi:hypothetical protein
MRQTAEQKQDNSRRGTKVSASAWMRTGTKARTEVWLKASMSMRVKMRMEAEYVLSIYLAVIDK